MPWRWTSPWSNYRDRQGHHRAPPSAASRRDRRQMAKPSPSDDASRQSLTRSGAKPAAAALHPPRAAAPAAPAAVRHRPAPCRSAGRHLHTRRWRRGGAGCRPKARRFRHRSRLRQGCASPRATCCCRSRRRPRAPTPVNQSGFRRGPGAARVAGLLTPRAKEARKMTRLRQTIARLLQDVQNTRLCSDLSTRSTRPHFMAMRGALQ